MSTPDSASFVDVVLVQAGNEKTDVILAFREATTKETSIKMIDLAMAKQLTDAAPCVVVPNAPLAVGERIKASLERAGASVELKPA